MNVEDHAQLALLLEVAGTPKPGNVDRRRAYPDLRFEHFLAGAVGAREGLASAATGAAVGTAFERAVEGMSEQEGGNTQFGALLLLVPLVRVAASGTVSRDGVRDVVESTTVDDAAAFYRAFEHVDVAVADPPEELADLDVRRGADAVPSLKARGVSLYDVMDRSSERDGVAREWTSGFDRSFDAADRILDGTGAVTDRAASVFLELLSEEPDTFVAINHDEETARRASDRARMALEGEIDPDDLAEEFVASGINPGTTADITAAGLFVALERGLVV